MKNTITIYEVQRRHYEGAAPYRSEFYSTMAKISDSIVELVNGAVTILPRSAIRVRGKLYLLETPSPIDVDVEYPYIIEKDEPK